VPRKRGQSPGHKSQAKQPEPSASASSAQVSKDRDDEAFIEFRRSYLTAFLCGASSDWLKGPYIYRFYESNGFQPEDITLLFAAGYVSSAGFGLLAGLMSDALGRKRMCLAFCALYMVHCALHVFTSFRALLLARVISGVATSLLFSAFEAWMVAEHSKRFASRKLAETFAMQTQGNALAAVVAGMVAQAAVAVGGYGAPMVVAVPLLSYAALEISKWPENVGCKRAGLVDVAFGVVATMDLAVARVGALQCLFEGSMHIFVFLWTPCLQRASGGQEIPNGIVFSLYMVCMMLGGRQALPSCRWQPSLGVIFLLAAVCLLMPSLSHGLWWNLAAFCGFEWCVGCYFPQIAVLRSEFLSEQTRSATMTLFRVPFNCIVVAMLIWGRSMPPEAMLRYAAAALAVGAGAFCTLPQKRTDAKLEGGQGSSPSSGAGD